MDTIAKLLQTIAENPNAGLPTLAIIFGLAMFWVMRGDKANDAKVLDIFSSFVSSNQTLAPKLDMLTGALGQVERGLFDFAASSKAQHTATRQHVTKHEDDLTLALEIFGNTQKLIVKELKTISLMNGQIESRLSSIDTGLKINTEVTNRVETKTDIIMNKIDALDLSRIIELLESIRSDNLAHFQQTTKRLDNIEKQVKPIIEREQGNEQKTENTDSIDSIRDVVRGAVDTISDGTDRHRNKRSGGHRGHTSK